MSFFFANFVTVQYQRIMIKRLIFNIALPLSMLSISGTAANPESLPIVQILGKDYYVYTARKGESLFGLAREYGWDDKQLMELNPSAVSPLKKGLKIYYPVEKTSSSQVLTHPVKKGETVYSIASRYGMSVERIYELNPSAREGIKAGDVLALSSKSRSDWNKLDFPGGKYKIKKGDTLYGVAKTHNVSVASIMKLNPGVSATRFIEGENIKLPSSGTGLEERTTVVSVDTLAAIDILTPKKNDNWEQISERTGVDTNLLKQANPGVTKLSDKTAVAVPRTAESSYQETVFTTDPREESIEGIEEIYRELHNIPASGTSEMLKFAVLPGDGSSNMDLEYMRGFLTALSVTKDSPVSFTVLDPSLDSSDIIERLDRFKPDVVFSLSEKNIPDFLNDYSEVGLVPVVNVFDIKSEDYISNPYILQLLSPSSMFNETVARYAAEKWADRILIFAGTEDPSDQLAASLCQYWPSGKIKRLALDEINPEVFVTKGKYIVYGFDVKKQDVSELASAVAKAREEKPLADIELLGRPNWIMYEESLADDLKRASASIPSRFYINKDSREYKEFLESYRGLFNREPMKSLPLYAAVGYDNARYFISGLKSSNGDITNLVPSSDGIQSAYGFSRPDNWSGMINPVVFMVTFSPSGIVTRETVSYED